jgi:hypothetical protein
VEQLGLQQVCYYNDQSPLVTHFWLYRALMAKALVDDQMPSSLQTLLRPAASKARLARKGVLGSKFLLLRQGRCVAKHQNLASEFPEGQVLHHGMQVLLVLGGSQLPLRVASPVAANAAFCVVP